MLMLSKTVWPNNMVKPILLTVIDKIISLNN